ncbi:type 2 isopentenyl-diphosphate Delta-isomerase [Oceanivirga salmonicida]|uniref:type 2 isopentenyl-diphosphate Delta-isomerase n=1 Tax=Oceanivirga salmonicida TaxID=1769291 RepID=UPI0012E15D38|nr:type 2 isopentenyl-diphosphate Delta-isomerase [Oceanivirga salmonicida]
MKKDQHMKYALECKTNNSLNDIRLKYFSMPEISMDEIDISTSFCGIDFKYPIYINAMTGGSENADNINKRLEYISKKLEIFMFSGSYTPNLNNNKYYYPKNLGVNLGADKSIDDMKKAINETNAKIIQIHLNPMQELMMVDGDRNFKTYTKNISLAIKSLDIPIILKETGYGMNGKTIEKAISLGIKTIDISGKGGTNFSYIEDKRANKNREYMYEIGYTTKESLLSSIKYQDRVEILASGGIESPMDIVKCLSMGAKAVGMSGHILKLLNKYDDDKIIEIIKEYINEIKILMCITNSKNLKELKGKWEEVK